MKLRQCIITVFALWATASIPLFAATWEWEGSDLTPDPAIKWGVLDNGLRYAIMPHQEPPERASLRLLVEAGSLHETDIEQGIAHYLEHMAFNGSKHFPPGELVEFFQELGMAFGPDTNAHTSFNETVYKFELPEADADTLSQGLLGLRDYADGLLLLEDEVNKERGVILSEMRDGDTPGFRAVVHNLKDLMPQSVLPRRLPIGLEETVRAVDATDFRRFYDRWYTPDRMAVVAVGDFEVETVERLIEERFGTMEANPHPLPDPNLGVVLPRGEAYSTYFDAELPAMDVSITAVTPYEHRPDSVAERRLYLALKAATEIVNRRLGILSREPDAPFTSAAAYAYDYFKAGRIAGIQATAKPEQWADALAVIEKELRKALEFGFTEREFGVFVANELNDLETAVAQADSREAQSISQGISDSMADGWIYLSPAQELELHASLLDALTPADAVAALRSYLPEGERLVRLEGNEEVEDVFLAVMRTYRDSLAVAVEAPVEEEALEFAYTDFGPEGEIASVTEVEGLEATRVEFANGVVLHHKQTDYEKGQVRVALAFGEGAKSLPTDQAGLINYAGFAYTLGGLKAHSVDDIQTIFAGKTVGANFAAASDHFALNGVTTPKDLVEQMQLLTAYLVAPGFRTEADAQLAGAIPSLYQQLDHTIDGVAQTAVEAMLSGGDPRFGWPEQAVMMERGIAEVAAWIADAREQAPLEVAIVGDISLEAALDAAKVTVAALPARTAPNALTGWAHLETLDVAAPGQRQEFTYSTQIPKGRATVYWPTVDQRDILVGRRLSVLASVMTDRMRVKVREAIGEAYSPFAYHRTQDVYAGFGFVTAVVNTDPGQTEMITQILVEIGNDLATNGITEDEFNRVLKPLVSSLEQQQRNNNYWLNQVLLGAAQRNYQLEWSRSLFTDYPSITREEVEALAREYLPAERAIQVLIKPVVDETAQAEVSVSTGQS